jgi:hypothetical protein
MMAPVELPTAMLPITLAFAVLGDAPVPCIQAVAVCSSAANRILAINRCATDVFGVRGLIIFVVLEDVIGSNSMNSMTLGGNVTLLPTACVVALHHGRTMNVSALVCGENSTLHSKGWVAGWQSLDIYHATLVMGSMHVSSGNQ